VHHRHTDRQAKAHGDRKGRTEAVARQDERNYGQRDRSADGAQNTSGVRTSMPRRRWSPLWSNQPPSSNSATIFSDEDEPRVLDALRCSSAWLLWIESMPSSTRGACFEGAT